MELSPIISAGNYEKHKTKWLKNYVYIPNRHTSKLFYFFYFVFKRCKTRKIGYCKSVLMDPKWRKKHLAIVILVSCKMLLVGLRALTELLTMKHSRGSILNPKVFFLEIVKLFLNITNDHCRTIIEIHISKQKIKLLVILQSR